MICNCIYDISRYLCDIPNEWKEGITQALCFVYSDDTKDCNTVHKCETLTYLSPFTLLGNTLSISYKDENNLINTYSVDLSTTDYLSSTTPGCLTTAPLWAELSDLEKIQMIIDKSCNCCTTTTTSSSTTTTTTISHEFFNATEYTCFGDGNGCKEVSEVVIVHAPVGTINIGSYYQGIDNPSGIYHILSSIGITLDSLLIDNTSEQINCFDICPTTTTSTSTTSTTTIPTTTTTSTSTTSTSSTTSTTTLITGQFIVEVIGNDTINNITGIIHDVTLPITGATDSGSWFNFTGGLISVDLTVIAPDVTLSLLYNGITQDSMSVGTGVHILTGPAPTNGTVIKIRTV